MKKKFLWFQILFLEDTGGSLLNLLYNPLFPSDKQHTLNVFLGNINLLGNATILL